MSEPNYAIFLPNPASNPVANSLTNNLNLQLFPTLPFEENRVHSSLSVCLARHFIERATALSFFGGTKLAAALQIICIDEIFSFALLRVEKWSGCSDAATTLANYVWHFPSTGSDQTLMFAVWISHRLVLQARSCSSSQEKPLLRCTFRGSKPQAAAYAIKIWHVARGNWAGPTRVSISRGSCDTFF